MPNKDGSLNQYELNIGYKDRTILNPLGDQDTFVDLSYNGATYDVDVHKVGRPRRIRRLVHGPDERVWGIGYKILEGWAQFETLTEARRFKRKLLKAPGYEQAVTICAATWMDG